MSPEELQALCTVLRANRVTHYRAGDCEIRMAPDVAREEKPEPTAAPEELCACGHFLTDHTEGGCVHACAEAVCEKWADAKSSSGGWPARPS